MIGAPPSPGVGCCGTGTSAAALACASLRKSDMLLEPTVQFCSLHGWLNSPLHHDIDHVGSLWCLTYHTAVGACLGSVTVQIQSDIVALVYD